MMVIKFSRGDTAQAIFMVHYGKLAVDGPDHRDIELKRFNCW